MGEQPRVGDTKWYKKRRVLLFAILGVAVLVVLLTPSSPQEQVPAPQERASKPPVSSSDTTVVNRAFVDSVAAQNDCRTLAAMGVMQRQNGDLVRWSVISNRVAEVGCDVTSDEFDGFFY